MSATERALLKECYQLIDQNLTFINGTDNLLQKIEACLAKPVQEPEPSIRYKVTILTDEHPSGIPLEQWAKSLYPPHNHITE